MINALFEAFLFLTEVLPEKKHLWRKCVRCKVIGCNLQAIPEHVWWHGEAVKACSRCNHYEKSAICGGRRANFSVN